MTTDENQLKRKHTYSYLLVLSIFSAACFFTAMFMSGESPGTSALKATIPAAGSEVGPIHVERDNSVYTIEVTGSLNLSQGNTWGFIEGELLDENKEFLMGFGDEMWKERDSEGTYENNTYSLSLTIPKQGIYYLKFKGEYPSANSADAIIVTVIPIRGNSHMHFLMGIFAFAIVLYFYWKFREDNVPRSPKKKSADSGGMLKMVFWVGVFALFIWMESQC